MISLIVLIIQALAFLYFAWLMFDRVDKNDYVGAFFYLALILSAVIVNTILY